MENNPVRKRRRPAVACSECRRRKVKCDKLSPCTPCTQSTLICEYTLVSFIDQQPRQNTAQALQIPSEAGNGEDGNQFGSLSYYSGEPNPSWYPSPTFTNLENTHPSAYMISQGIGPRTMQNAIPSFSGYGSEHSPILTRGSLTAISNTGLLTPTTRNEHSFSRTKSLGPIQWINIFEQVNKSIQVPFSCSTAV